MLHGMLKGVCGISGLDSFGSEYRYPSPVLLPDVGDVVLMIITSVYTPQRFFAQLPLGAYVVSDDTGNKYLCTPFMQNKY